jgi:hypothetical protein
MKSMFFLVAIFLQLHGPDGQTIDVNPEQITSLRMPQASAGDHFPKGTKCILKMTNGSINAVVESCEAIRHMLKEERNAQ